MMILHDPIIASWAQALIYLGTLGVLIVQLRILVRQTRSQAHSVELQTESLRQSEYLRCQTDFTESTRLMTQTGLHAKVYDDLAARAGGAFANWTHYSEIDKITYAYLEMLYEIFEREGLSLCVRDHKML